MADLSSFQQYYKLADVLIEQASKEQLAECARLLALNLVQAIWPFVLDSERVRPAETHPAHHLDFGIANDPGSRCV